MLKERYPSKLLEDAVEAIGTLPGVGKRSAMRLALHVLRQPSDNVHHLADALVHLRDDVKYCRECMMISDSDVCSICSDTRRDHNTICVVETVRDVMSIENTGRYGGVYHVLGGSISPIDGIGPSDLSIAPLVERVKALCASVTPGPDPVTPGPDRESPEIILALSGDVEGETTAFYLYRQLSALPVRITTLARGLGFGDDLEYADEVTLGRSLAARQPFKP
ncbi:MAG: recombination protein RecR [Bacteroidales bacterium]|nr:recombination protein RecR [Bacteroidales bacterium]